MDSKLQRSVFAQRSGPARASAAGLCAAGLLSGFLAGAASGPAQAQGEDLAAFYKGRQVQIGRRRRL